MDNKNTIQNLLPHLMMAGACAIWGLMAPLGKHAMTHGIDGFSMVFLRVAGSALCFWTTSVVLGLHRRIRRGHHANRMLTHEERASKLREVGLFAIAAIFGITCNQCCFTIGLSKTSPINASILTTTLPIFALLIGAIFLKRAVTWRKGSGVAIGMIGAILLIISSAGGTIMLGNGNIVGDILVIGAQCSFAIYLNFFQGMLKRHSVVTIQKWMMTFAALYVLPIAWPHLAATDWFGLSGRVIGEALFVVICGTYVAYIMMTWAQKYLQPTSVAMYNYVQPIVACLVSVWMGIGHFGPIQLLAVALVFIGVWLVTQVRKA